MKSSSPSVVPVGSEESDEEVKKRERDRVYAKKSYEKKKSRVETLRAELATLEEHYKSLLESRHLSDGEVKHDPTSDCREGTDVCDEGDVDQEHGEGRGSALLLRRYKQLTELKQTLYEENEELLRLNTEWMILEARLQVVNDESAEPLLSEMPMHFRPLPYEMYRKAVLNCRDEAFLFAARPSGRSTGVKVFEWTDRRSVSGDALEFAFEKLISGFSAYELLQRTWSLLSNPVTNCKIYGSSMNAKSRVLQHVDNDTVLFYWTMRPRTVPVTFKSLYLLAKTPIAGGYMILFRSIDRHAVHWDEDGINAVIEDAQDKAHPVDGGATRSEFWAKFNNWIVIRETANPRACDYHFGGSSKASLWEVEVLLMCLRWEHLALGKRLLVR